MAKRRSIEPKRRGGEGSEGASSRKKQKPTKSDDNIVVTKDEKAPDKPLEEKSTVVLEDKGPKETWSKSKKKRMRMLLSKQNKKESASSMPQQGAKDTETSTPNPPLDIAESIAATKSRLQDAFKARLSGSRFRILNEELYTKTSEESFKRFSENPELFEQYHEGFRHQVESWPVNPVDVIVRWLSSRYQQSTCTVADFGCGDAQLAKNLLKIKNKGICPFTVHSFDLVSPNELVTACDMSNVPLKDKSVDVCVFCLSLMGTNLADFIREAHRVLKDDGRVKIAEVRSRIEYSHSRSKKEKGQDKEAAKNSGTLNEFLDVLKALGFKCTKKDLSNKMFLVLELEKTGKAPDKKLAFSAKPCIYKRR